MRCPHPNPIFDDKQSSERRVITLKTVFKRIKKLAWRCFGEQSEIPGKRPPTCLGSILQQGTDDTISTIFGALSSSRLVSPQCEQNERLPDTLPEHFGIAWPNFSQGSQPTFFGGQLEPGILGSQYSKSHTFEPGNI